MALPEDARGVVNALELGNALTISQTKLMATSSVYSAFDVISENISGGTAWVFSGVVNVVGGQGVIEKSILMCTTSGLTTRMMMHLYNRAPNCSLNDTSINNSPVIATDREGYVGKILYSTEGNGGASEATVVPGGISLPLPFICTSNDTRLYGVVFAYDGFNEISGDRIFISMDIKRK